MRMWWMTASASSRRPFTTSHLGDSGSITSAAAAASMETAARNSLSKIELSVSSAMTLNQQGMRRARALCAIGAGWKIAVSH